MCVCACVRFQDLFSPNLMVASAQNERNNLYMPLNPIQEEEKYFVVLTYCGREYIALLISIYTFILISIQCNSL